MTQIDDAASAASDILKRTEDCVNAFNAMNAESRGRLQQWFPTLNTSLALLVARWKAAGLDTKG